MQFVIELQSLRCTECTTDYAKTKVEVNVEPINYCSDLITWSKYRRHRRTGELWNHLTTATVAGQIQSDYMIENSAKT